MKGYQPGGYQPKFSSYLEHARHFALRHERRFKAEINARRRLKLLQIAVVAFWTALFVLCIVGLFVPEWK